MGLMIFPMASLLLRELNILRVLLSCAGSPVDELARQRFGYSLPALRRDGDTFRRPQCGRAVNRSLGTPNSAASALEALLRCFGIVPSARGVFRQGDEYSTW